MSKTWLNAFFYFLSSPSFSNETIILMLKSFVEHAEYLVKFHTKGNWLIHEMTGLYHVGSLFPEFKDSVVWRDVALKSLHEALLQQVYPDGTHYELTTTYHLIALRYFVRTLHLAQLNNYPLPSTYLARLENMYSYNLFASMPDRSLPGLNDGRPTDIRKSLHEGSQLFPHREDFIWIASDGSEGVLPSANSYAFPFAGQFIMRSDWGRNARYLLFDAGPFGFGHQHEDKLNFIIHAYGRALLIDPGNYAYDRSKWRKYVKSSYAHNVIHVDGKEQHRRGLNSMKYIVQKPLPHVWKSTETYDYAAAHFGILPEEGFGEAREKVAIHERHILYIRDADTPHSRDYWLVADILTPSDDHEHTYEALFHLDTRNVAVDMKTKQVVTLNKDSANLAIIPVNDASLSLDVVKGQEDPYVQGWIPSGRYGVRPIPTVVFTRQTRGKTEFIYLFYPLPEGMTVPVKSIAPLRSSSELPRLKVEFMDGMTDELQLKPGPVVKRTIK
jgi:hypothetical protein